MPIYNSRGDIISQKKRLPRNELGGTGRNSSSIFQQILSTDEYLSALRPGRNGDVAVYNKMERSDAQIKAILLMVSLPIRATQWFIRPKDNSRKAQKIADFIEESLFGGFGIGLNNGFDSFIKDVTTMFTYGFSAFEKVFEVRKGNYKWKKFAVRPQSTIEDFYYDSVGDFIGFQQSMLPPNNDYVDIPVEKSLMFTHDMQQGDARGISLLRSAYKHWYIKDFLYKITNVGIERNLVGTPVLTLPENYTQEDMDLAEDIVTTLKSSEFGGATMPEGFVLSMFEGKRTLMDVMPYIEHQDRQISLSILAQFMNLGTGSSGSFALSSSQSDLFLMMLDASAKNIANTLNTHAIPELVSYNFASDLFPTLSFKPMNSTKIVNTIKTLLDGKLVLPDDDLEDYMRDMLDLPEKNPVKTREEYAQQFEMQQQQNQDIKETTNNQKQSDLEKESMSKTKTPINNTSKQKQYADKIKQDNIEKQNNKNNTLSESFTLKELDKNNYDKAIELINKQIMELHEVAEKQDFNHVSTIKIKYKRDLSRIIEDALNLKENHIKNTGLSSIYANNISEKIKSEFLIHYLNESTDIQDLIPNIITIL